MAYQELVVAKAVKAGIYDSDSRGAIWESTGYIQGMKFLNDGKTILIAENATALTGLNNATWDSVTTQGGSDYSVELEKTGVAGDNSIHFQFDPTKRITFGEFCTNIVAGAPTEYSFYHVCTGGAGNYAHWEFRFQDPVSFAMGVDHGWIEVTLLMLQGNAGAGGAFAQITITGATSLIYGGRTPDGTGASDFAPSLLSDLAAGVIVTWDAAEAGTGDGVANYVMERVRFELWEQNPQPRQCNIDTVVIDGDAYAVEPGMAGAKLGPSAPEVTLTFVTYRDRYGRLEALAPVVGALQTSIIGPLLPALFNDSAGYAKFEPSLDTALNVRYSVIRVDNAS